MAIHECAELYGNKRNRHVNMAVDCDSALLAHEEFMIDSMGSRSGYEYQETVLEQVLKMAPDYREVIYLYYYEGYDVKQIAEILGISQSAVKKRMQRARKQLKMNIKEDWGTC